jgi:hypothetical protein
LFYFAAMLAYFNGDAGRLRKPGRASYAAALLLFACAMFSKTVAATWPAAVLVIMWWKTAWVRQRDLWPLVPFFLIGVMLSRLTSQLEAEQVGAVGKDWDLSFGDRLIVAGRAIWFYAGKAIWPLRLTFIYPKWDLQNERALQALAAVAALAVVIALVGLSRRIGRGPAAAALLFIGTLAPALGFFNVYPMRYSFVADHFQYLAIVALIVPLAYACWRGLGRWACVLLIPLVALTWRHSEVLHDPITLWSDTAANNDGSWMTHENLGQAWQAAERDDLAEEQYRIAASRGAAEVEAWWKLGAFEATHGRYREAEQEFRKALAIDPTYAWAAEDLQKVLMRERKQGEHP